jgi:hypothetical protein
MDRPRPQNCACSLAALIITMTCGQVVNIFVDFTPLLLNSARYVVLFQNFVVLWKLHLSQNIILPADASHQDASNGMRVVYVNFYNMWVLRQG